VWRTCLASELDNTAHNGYLDANMGTSIPREQYPYMNHTWLDSLGSALVDISVLIESAVRVQIRTRTFWIGYNGRGPDKKLDTNHTNEKTFTIYRDGKIYVDATDTLLGGGGEHGGASGEHGPTGANSAKSTFIHPINAHSPAGFTLGTNFSMNALPLYPRGGGLAKWLLQWGQNSQPDPVTKVRCSANCTKMNFLQVPLNDTMSVSRSGHFSYTYFQPMQQSVPSRNAGYRWGVSPAALNFSAGASYTKSFLYQLGTEDSSLLPNLVTLRAANSIADAYLQPPQVRAWIGGAADAPTTAMFNHSEGCYRIIAARRMSPARKIRFNVETTSELLHPVFCLEGFGWPSRSPSYTAKIGSIRLLAHEFELGIESNAFVVQVLRTLRPGQHELFFEQRSRA
jgi:hypothetical protein